MRDPHGGRTLARGSPRRLALHAGPGRWTLGAGGAVDVGENPVDTLGRELVEEWSVEAERLTGEALLRLPHRLILFIGLAWLPDGAEVTPDNEHDAHAWWPAESRTGRPRQRTRCAVSARLLADRPA